MSIYKNAVSMCTFLMLVASTTSAHGIEDNSVSTPAKPTVQLLQEPADTPNSENSNIDTAKYSVVLNCDGCKISQVSISWDVKLADLETVELFYINGDNRTRLITLGSADSSSDTKISNTYDIGKTRGACFTITTTYLNGSSETSQESCFVIT